MGFSTIPPFAGFLGMAFLPNTPEYKWTKWGCYFMTVPFVISLFLAWSLIPSNTAGRTKRTLTSSFTFVGYCVGNMVGSQIFKSKDAVSAFSHVLPSAALGLVLFSNLLRGVSFLADTRPSLDISPEPRVAQSASVCSS